MDSQAQLLKDLLKKMPIKDIVTKCKFIKDEETPRPPKPHAFKKVKVPPKKIVMDPSKLIELDLPLKD